MTIKLLIPVYLAVTMLTSCSLAPRYERPMAPVATQWPTSAGVVPVLAVEAAAEPHVADIGWRSMFTSPKLLSLIEAALANNRDLRIATLNIEAARNTYRIQRADLMPSINASGSAIRQRLSESHQHFGKFGNCFVIYLRHRCHGI